MASFSPATRELVLKIVYYGPGLGGKTTTLKTLHASVRAEHRGKMISLATPVDRTLYFDFLPVRLPNVSETQLRLQLFTVPGQVYFNATRKLVLTGADGIVFVADSQEARGDANAESLDNLRDNLAELGRTLTTVPIVFAYNKRDLPGILSIEDLDKRLNPDGRPSLPASAATGQGVFETLDAVVRLALDDLRARHVIPPETIAPADGTIAARLANIRTPPDAPRADAPTRIVPSGPMVPPAATAPAPPAPPPATESTPTPVRPPAAPSVATMAPPPATATTTGAPAFARRAGVSFTTLFDAEDQETVRTIEEAVSEGLWPRAILLLEALLVRVLERGARAMGRGEAPPEWVAWALALPPERYARARASAQRVRRGGEVSRRDVLEGYLLVSMAQVGVESLAR